MSIVTLSDLGIFFNRDLLLRHLIDLPRLQEVQELLGVVPVGAGVSVRVSEGLLIQGSCSMKPFLSLLSFISSVHLPRQSTDYRQPGPEF